MNKIPKKLFRYAIPLMVFLLVGFSAELAFFSKTAFALPYACNSTSPTAQTNQDIVFNASGDDTGSGIDGFYWSSGGSPGVGSGWSYTTRFSTPGIKTVYISTSSDSFTVHCTVEVTANFGQMTAGITANGSPIDISISAGASATIAWTSSYSGAYNCQVTNSGNSTEWTGVSGSQSTGVLFSARTYIETCTATDGSGIFESDSITVNISGLGITTGDITVNPAIIQAGSNTIVTWTSTGADECEVGTDGLPGNPLWAGVAGSKNSGNLVASVTYSLHCDGQIMDSATVTVIFADLKVSSNTANNNGPFVDGPLELPATGVQVRLKATCGASGGSGRISPGNINFAGTSHYVNVNFNTSPKTWTLTCYPSPSQSGTPTATDFVTVQLTSPDFTLACNTVSKTVTAGASTVFDTTVTAINGFNSQVTVDVSAGLPANASSTPVVVTPTAVASVPVSTQVTTPAGTSNLTFTATGGGKTHTCISQLIVTSGAPYLVSLAIDPKTSSIIVGGTQSYTTEASYSDGSTAPVTNSSTFGSSDENIARSAGGADFSGTDNGVATITGTYIEGAITTADTAELTVGSGAGSLTASVTCPSGADTCTIPYNTSIMLTWTSTGADNGCSMSPALIPPVNTESGTASTGELTATTVYTVTCTGPDKNLPPATDTATVIVNPAAESFVNSDKDITSINGSAVANGSCNGGTDTVTKTLTTGDQVSFKINLCNVGSSTASNVIVADELNNLAKPATGWNAKYNGGNITPVESGVSPNQTLTFTLPGTITAGSTKSLTFDAVVTPPTPITNTVYRFQNIARISTANGAWTASTPLYLFYAGSKVPSKQEVAP